MTNADNARLADSPWRETEPRKRKLKAKKLTELEEACGMSYAELEAFHALQRDRVRQRYSGRGMNFPGDGRSPSEATSRPKNRERKIDATPGFPCGGQAPCPEAVPPSPGATSSRNRGTE